MGDRLLTQKKCLPCEGIGKAFDDAEIAGNLTKVVGWALVTQQGVPMIEKHYQFANFAKALEFVNRVGEIAESEGHHPDILIHGWNKVVLTLYTHALSGLTENDFVVAAKVDEVIQQAG